MSTRGRAPAGDRAPRSWSVVAAREVSVKVRDRTFLLSTAFMLVLIVGFVAFSGFMAGRESHRVVAVLDADARAVVELAEEQGQRVGGPIRLQARSAADAAEVTAWLEGEEVDLALVSTQDAADVRGTDVGARTDEGTGGQGAVDQDGGGQDGEGSASSAATGGDARWQVIGFRGVDEGARDLLAGAVSVVELDRNARQAGTSGEEVLTGTGLDVRSLDPAALDSGPQYVITFGFAFLFYVTALVFGMAIAQSVIEEKQSRVVEILAAAVPIRQLLWGKVIGNTLLAIGQVVLLAGVGLAGLAVSGQGDVLAEVLGASLWFVVFFLLGFAALACVWAVAGSIATRQEDLQATTLPIQAVVFAALFVGIAGTGTVLTVGSYVPLVSSVAMPVRLLGGGVPWWEPVLSAGVVLLAAAALVALGARLYEGSLLRTDRRTTLREALDRD